MKPLQGLLGYTAFGGIVWREPLFMFVFLFGISMDYHVFILSRIRERLAAVQAASNWTSSGRGTSRSLQSLPAVCAASDRSRSA